MNHRDLINQTIDAYLEMQDTVTPPPIRLWCLKCADAGIRVIERSWEVLAKAAGEPLVPSDLAPIITRIGFLMVREGLKRGTQNAGPVN